MATLVERAREVVSAEADDFFQADTILYYLNKSQQKIVAFMLRLEQESNKSLRSLDSLRQHEDITVNGLTFTDNGSYFTAEVNFPASPDDINQFIFVKYGDSTVMRELSQNNRIKLEWSNLTPSDYESYYMITKTSTDDVAFQIFTEADDSATNKDLRVYYIQNPTEIQLADETTDELPNRLQNALIYGAAKLMVSQESINDEISQRSVQLFQQTYQEELQNNAY